jgi:hypothetical protein
MKHRLAIYGLVGIIALTTFAIQGCARSASGSLQVLAWDRNVTVVKKQKRRKYKGRNKQVHSRAYNRVPHRTPGR